MRIFYFPSFYPSDRAAEKWTGAFTHRQVKALRGLGVDVKVILPQLAFPIWPVYTFFNDWKVARQRAHPERRVFEDIEIFHPAISNWKPSRVFRKPFNKRYSETVINLLKTFKLDPATDYFFAQWLPEAGYVVDIAKQLGIRIAILGIGDDILKMPLLSETHFTAFRKCWEGAHIRGVVADYLGKEANRLVGKSLPYHVFYSSVDFGEFYPIKTEEKRSLRSRLNLPQEKVIILTVGSPIVRKGWLDLFDALKKIDGKKQFVLIGIHGGNAEIDLDAEISHRGLQNNWINVGEIAPADMNSYYQASDIFCLPSHWEGLANAVLEAMACALPVVTTPVAGHPEVINSGFNGIFVSVGDSHALADQLEYLIKSGDLRKSIGSEAHYSVMKKPGSHIETSKLIVSALQNT